MAYQDPPIPVRKLVAEEGRKLDILDGTLSGGFWGVVSASGGEVRCACRSRHSSTEVGGTEINSAGVLFANVSTALAPLTADITSSCDVVFTPSVWLFDDGKPRMGGLSNLVGDSVRRLSMAASEGNEAEDGWDEVGIPSTSPFSVC